MNIRVSYLFKLKQTFVILKLKYLCKLQFQNYNLHARKKSEPTKEKAKHFK